VPARPLSSGGTRAQALALAELEARSGGAWLASFDPATGTARFLGGRLAGARAAGETLEAAALRFVREHEALVGVRAAELSLLDERRDAADLRTTAVLSRRVGGIPIEGEHVNVAFDDEGALVSLRAGAGGPIAFTGAFTADDAAVTRRAREAAAAKLGGAPEAFAARLERVVARDPRAPGEGRPRIVVELAREDGRAARARFDGATGALLELTDAGASSEYVVVNKTDARGESRAIETESGWMTYRGTSTRWIASHDGTTSAYVFRCNPRKCEWIQTGEGTAWPGDVVSAHANYRATYDAWRLVFGRSGPDGKGSRVDLLVYDEGDKENAYWTTGGSGRAGAIAFLVPAANQYAISASPDLVGHEFTHGVVAYTLGLVDAGQASALDESLADVFGIWAKQYACYHGYVHDCGQLLHYGEMGYPKRAYYVRDIASPSLKGQRDHMTDFWAAAKVGQTERHVDAGIPTKAWHLVARGGKHRGLGPARGLGDERAWRIWHQAAFEGAREPNLDFYDFAVRTIAAAGSDRMTVACAWLAVGVGNDEGQCKKCNACGGAKRGGVGTRAVAGSAGGCEAAVGGASFRAAAALPAGRELCGEVSGARWFKATVKAGEPFALDLPEVSGDVDVRVFDGAGNVLGVSERLGASAEHVRFVPDADGEVFVRLSAAAPSTFTARQGFAGAEADGPACPLSGDCLVDPKAACASGDVCSWNGDRHCCKAPWSDGPECFGDGDCAPGEVCGRSRAGAGGTVFRCTSPDAHACR